MPGGACVVPYGLNRRMPNGTYWWCERGYKLAPTRFWKEITVYFCL